MTDQNAEQNTEKNVEQAEDRTYTQAEVDALLQRETDRRVSSALKKQERKNEAKVKEAQRLAAMNEDQRYQYELEQREKAIQEKEAALAVAENKAAALEVLSGKGISGKLVSLVVAEDADTMMANINLLDQAFKESVKAEVEKRLATSTPKKNLPLDAQLTKETFNKMSLTQQAQVYESNPDLYKTLTS